MESLKDLLLIVAIAGPVLSIGTAYGIIQSFKKETERRLKSIENNLVENRVDIEKNKTNILELKSYVLQTKAYMKEHKQFMIDFRQEYRNDIVKFEDKFADYDKNTRDFYEKYSPILNPKNK